MKTINTFVANGLKEETTISPPFPIFASNYYPMRTLLLLSVFLCLLSPTLSAQEFSGGFRAGLNFVSIVGPQEMSADGSTVYEIQEGTTGFHVGATFALAFTDLFGIKADLMYSQKGGKSIFGSEETGVPSYFYLYDDAADTEGSIIFGQRRSELAILNSYIDIPVTAYYRIGPIELEGGLSAGFLVNSRVSGGAAYETSAFGPRTEVIFNVDGNFNSDPAGGAGVISRADVALPGGVFPPNVVSAYYNSNKDDNLYSRLSFGAIVGASFYLNNGLFIGARYQFGLSDITNGENDLRVVNEGTTTDRVFNTDDEDNTRSVQVSVGFRF